MLPNLLIVGAQKSGTTSLHRLLDTHRQIFLPSKPQEIHYFDIEANYRRGVDWYCSHFVGWQGEPWCGQTSPLYMYEPQVPQRISRLLPEARSIFILRNPVERAYSHYWHEVRYGYESRSFLQAIEREPERLTLGFEARRQFSYVDRGRYPSQIRRFLDQFDRRRLLILRLDDLRDSPEALCAQLADFLGIPVEGFRWSENRAVRHNQGMVPRVWALQRIRRVVHGILPHAAYVIDRLNLRRTDYPPLGNAERSLLHRLLDPEIEELGRLTGLPVESWLG